MHVTRNNRLAEWTERILERDGSRLSYRQAENRTGVSYATVRAMTEGRQVGAESVMRFAVGFGQDLAEALDVAGYPDLASVWRTGAAPIKPAQTAKLTPEQEEYVRQEVVRQLRERLVAVFDDTVLERDQGRKRKTSSPRATQRGDAGRTGKQMLP